MTKNHLNKKTITAIKEEVKKHIRNFEIKTYSKDDSKNTALYSAGKIYRKLQDKSDDMRDTNTLSNIKYAEIDENYLNKTGHELLIEIVNKAPTQLFEWYVAIELVIRHLIEGQPMPELLSKFTISALDELKSINDGEKVKRFNESKTLLRDEMIASCVFWVVTDDEFGIRNKLSIEETITEYLGEGGNSDKITACHIVAEALEELGIIISYDNTVKQWKKFKPKN